MTTPVYIGSGTVVAGTGAITNNVSGLERAGDLLILTVTACAQAVATPAGWTYLTSATVGTAGATTLATNIYIFYYHYKGTLPTLVVADSGVHTIGQIHTYRYASTWMPNRQFWTTPLVSANTSTVASGTSISLASLGIGSDCAVLQCVATDLDSATLQYSSWSSSVSGLSQITNYQTTTGSGGGFITYTGYISSGSTGTTTCNVVSTQALAAATVVILPGPSRVYAVT